LFQRLIFLGWVEFQITETMHKFFQMTDDPTLNFAANKSMIFNAHSIGTLQ
jgi:hypothetical protein